MTFSLPVESLRTDARALASAGSWPAVAALLAPLATDALRDGEIALLYAESRMRCGQAREALAWLQAVLGRMGEAPDRAQYRRAVNMMGAASLALGQLDDAATSFGEALELATDADDLLMLAQATNNLGAIANLRGQHELALWHYRIALPTLQRLGEARRLAEGYHNIAITYRDMGELEEADEHERRAIDYATSATAPRVAAMGRVGRAEIALRRGDAPLAEMTASLAAEELSSLADPLNEADARRLVGAACTAQNRPADALVAFERALGIADSFGHTLNRAEVLRDRVEAWEQQGVMARAIGDARQAAGLFASLGARAEVDRLERRLNALGG